MDELMDLLNEQGKAFKEFKSVNDSRLADLEKHLNEFYKKANRPPAGFASAFEPGAMEEKHTFLGYLRTGRENDLQKKAMSTDDDPSGGYLVPKIIDDIVSKALRELSPMRQIARVVKVESGDFSMLHSVGGTGYAWVGETQSRPETDTPRFQEIRPEMGEIYALPGVTQRLLDDNGFDLENWLIDELSEAFSEGEGEAFLSGDGVNKPRGFLTYDISNEADGIRSERKIQYVASGGSGSFASSNPSDKLIKLVYTLKPRYRRNAVWVINSNTLEQIRTMKNDQKDYIWKPGIESGQPSTLLGYPVYEDENMPDISGDSLSIAFGDFLRGYTIVDRNSSMLRDPFTAKPNVLFYSTRRVGGSMRDFRAIKLMKFSAN
ncbi:phage major capsid protein [Candidatus Kuenenia sp.]|uniref:phage major capsid protein n=1 Tax=Candidatus Kuenenia sp. TaxID=2499824 RepID=UPI0032209CD8